MGVLRSRAGMKHKYEEHKTSNREAGSGERERPDLIVKGSAQGYVGSPKQGCQYDEQVGFQ